MSLYRPDPNTLYPALLMDGWWVMDKFGRLDGPYVTVLDARKAITAESDLPARHSLYREG